MSTKALAKQRTRYWQTDPRCHYCGTETILKPSHIKGLVSDEERDRLATIDHLRPRHHPERLKQQQQGEKLHVLACWKCNNERDRRELAAKPKEWFEERGGTKPLHKRSVEELKQILTRTGFPFPLGHNSFARKKWIQVKQSQIAILWAIWEKGMD